MGMTRPMKKVTQVSPREASPTENSGLTNRLAKLLALNASGLLDLAEVAQVAGEARRVPGRRRTPRHLDIVLEHEDVRALLRHLLLQRGVLLGALGRVELACRRQHVLGDLGDEPPVAPRDR